MSQVKVWGVMNITPDSFSDGGQLKSSADLLHSLTQFTLDGADVGAESTNPRAQPITAAQERERLECFLLPLLDQWPTHLRLSIDSYKLETMEWLVPKIPAAIHLVWNDVSGKVSEALPLLQQYPRLDYVACHNPAPTRAQSGQHMNYVSDGVITPQLREFFQKTEAIFSEADLLDRIIADPCFGFGKSRAQNYELLETLPSLMDELNFKSWMWGVSRKAFLREAGEDPHDEAVRALLHERQELWVSKALEKLLRPHTIILRTHLWKN